MSYVNDCYDKVNMTLDDFMKGQHFSKLSKNFKLKVLEKYLSTRSPYVRRTLRSVKRFL